MKIRKLLEIIHDGACQGKWTLDTEFKIVEEDNHDHPYEPILDWADEKKEILTVLVDEGEHERP